MKHLFILFLLLITTMGYSQIKTSPQDSTSHTTPMMKWATYDSTSFHNLGRIQPKPHYDTIPVIMLVSDTIQWQRDRDIIKYRHLVDTDTLGNQLLWDKLMGLECSYYFDRPQTIKGYEVVADLNRYTEYHGITQSMERHIAYLNSNKKPIRESLIIWQTIRTK